MPEKVPNDRLPSDPDTGDKPLLDQYKEDSYPVVCTDDINEEDGRVDNRRRCNSDGFYHVAILLPLKEKCNNNSRQNYATQTSCRYGSDQLECRLSQTSDQGKLEYAPHRRSFVVRHWCVIVAILFVFAFITALALVVGIVMDNAHKDREHKVLQNTNHSDEFTYTDLNHAGCVSFTANFDKLHHDTESNSEFALPWVVKRKFIADSSVNVIQLDNKNIQVKKSDWYLIDCMITIDSLSVQHSNARPAAASVCINIDPQTHSPVCNKVSMATNSIIPVQVSSRIFLRNDDVISIVVHTSRKKLIQQGHLQIHPDPC